MIINKLQIIKPVVSNILKNNGTSKIQQIRIGIKGFTFDNFIIFLLTPTLYYIPGYNLYIKSIFLQYPFDFPDSIWIIYTRTFVSVPSAVKIDSKLHELLALVDAIRAGRAREKEIAITELKKYLRIESK